MAYQAGDVILDDHYNTFATGSVSGAATDNANVNNLWGVGFADRGYGQSTTLSAVTAGTVVTATQWSTLLTRISSMASHQNSSISSITSPVAGETISAYSTLSTNINTIYVNRLNFAANGTDVTTTPATGTSAWKVRTVHTLVCSFQNANSARYYFNAGGSIRIGFNIAGGTADPKYNEWVDLANVLCGTIIFSAQGTTKSGGTGTPTVLASGLGYYDLTTTNQTIYQQYADSSPYTANYIKVEARYTGTLGSNGDKSPQVTFTVTYQDDATDDGFAGDVDVMNGTVTTSCTFRPPSATYLTNTWSNVSAPTMTFSNTQS